MRPRPGPQPASAPSGDRHSAQTQTANQNRRPMLQCMLRSRGGRGYGAQEFISAGPESLKIWLAGAEIRDDSAGKKGGHRSGPPFFISGENSWRPGSRVSVSLWRYYISTYSSAGRRSCRNSTFRSVVRRCPGTTSSCHQMVPQVLGPRLITLRIPPPARSTAISTFVFSPKMMPPKRIELPRLAPRPCQCCGRILPAASAGRAAKRNSQAWVSSAAATWRPAYAVSH